MSKTASFRQCSPAVTGPQGGVESRGVEPPPNPLAASVATDPIDAAASPATAGATKKAAQRAANARGGRKSIARLRSIQREQILGVLARLGLAGRSRQIIAEGEGYATPTAAEAVA